METLNLIVTLCSHFVFIGISYQLLATMVDWSKFIKLTTENMSKLHLLVLFLSLGLGYMVSHFFLELIQVSQNLFFMFR